MAGSGWVDKKENGDFRLGVAERAVGVATPPALAAEVTTGVDGRVRGDAGLPEDSTDVGAFDGVVPGACADACSSDTGK